VAIISFSASSEEVPAGSEVTLGWVTQQASSCEVTPDKIQAAPAGEGSMTVTVNATVEYTLTCQGPEGPVSSNSVTIGAVELVWAQVSAGSYHTCAVKSDGRLFCWGENQYGQLGDGFFSASLVPVQEKTIANDWVQVSAGDRHTCAVNKEGKLFCWGAGAYGRLGNDLLDATPVPTQESTAAADWKQVEAGSAHTCAVKRDGTLFCWGAGDYNRTNDDSPTPMQITSATDWEQVSAGYQHTCATKTSGELFCWGENQDGQLGNRSTSNSLIPVQESIASTDWKQVEAGQWHTCAVKTDGQLLCWGNNEYGQLGDGSTLKSTIPVQKSTAATDWVQVSTGSVHTCAVKADGQLFCWGDGGSGALGDGLISPSAEPVQESTAATDWTQVSAGWLHTCAIKNNVRLFCWGANQYGQLGDGTTSDGPEPVEVVEE
jgi:alpha-tubulin suppressor-like RCC1 family protein